MPDNITLAPEEIEEIVGIYVAIRRRHADIGSLNEKIMAKHDHLHELRSLETKWEKSIEEKYHIPSGINWRVDLDTKTIEMPTQETEDSRIEPSEGNKDQQTE